MKLHLGCGTKKLEGWVNIDSVKAVKPDLIHDITQPLPYIDDSVDEILAEDLLEHFDKYIRYVIFYDWVRVLKKGGKITIRVPDFKKIIFKYFKFGFDNFVDFIFGENLWNSKYYLGSFGNHKFGYSQKSLVKFINIFGLNPVKIEKKGLNIQITAIKDRTVSNKDIENIEIFSHANKFGNGKQSVKLSFVMEKIDEFYENKNNFRK